MISKVKIKSFLKTVKKKLFANRVSNYLLAVIVYLYIKLVFHTTSWHRQIYTENFEDYISGNKQAIFAFWHGRLLMIPAFYPKNSQIDILISTHRDGQFITDVIKMFGINAVRGSSRKAKQSSTKELAITIESGRNIALTPDGPKGPRHKIKEGLANLAIKYQIPIIPIGYYTKNHRSINSWDRFLLPLPFGKGVFICNQAIFPPSNIEQENIHELQLIKKDFIASIEQKMIETENYCDNYDFSNSNKSK